MLIALVAMMSWSSPNFLALLSMCSLAVVSHDVLKGDLMHCAAKPATVSSESALKQDRPQQRKGSRDK